MPSPTSNGRWLAAQLPFIHEQLPAAARVLEIGCGPAGGFVPSLTAAGHDAIGIDPKAPLGDGYHQIEFEQYDAQHPMDVIVACTSLHHVADLDRVLDGVVDALVPNGTVVVVEWAHEWFDEATATWSFDRLAATEDEDGWLQRHRSRWEVSGQTWDTYLADWVGHEGLHRADDIIRALNTRFDRRHLARTPYVFSGLATITEADEQAAIDARSIRPTGIRYVGQRS